jgi:heavy metal sensor kinase
MAIRNPFRSVQVRLTAWHVTATALFVVLFTTTILMLLQRRLDRRVDASQIATCQALIRAVTAEAAEPSTRMKPIADLVREETRELVLNESEVAVFAWDGTLVASTRGSVIAPLNVIRAERLRDMLARARERSRFFTIEHDEETYRLYGAPFAVRGVRLIVFTARHRREQEELLRSVAGMLWIGAPLWIALSGFAGWLLVRRSLAPVASMSAEAAAIGSADVSKRLRVADPGNELGFLATAFNALLDRLGTTIEQQRRFMADASHELRTPIAIVRGEAEVALTRKRSAEELRDALAIIQKESEHLTAIVDDLFLLARADAGQRVLHPTRFYLDEILAEAVAAVRTLAASKEIALDLQAAADVELFADERLLARLFRNLLDNAVKYTPRAGRVTISMSCDQSHCLVDIRDTGLPIGPEAGERIFERFHRGAMRDVEGSGLGLAIGRSIAELHGGRLDLVPETTSGNVFRVRLPRA